MVKVVPVDEVDSQDDLFSQVSDLVERVVQFSVSNPEFKLYLPNVFIISPFAARNIGPFLLELRLVGCKCFGIMLNAASEMQQTSAPVSYRASSYVREIFKARNGL